MARPRKPPPSATEAALDALSHRALTERELRARLGRRHGEAEVDAAVARVREWGYLSDAQVSDRAAERGVARRVGRGRVARELSLRGVDDETAQAAVEERYAGRDDELLEQAVNEGLRAMGGVRSLPELARLARRLVARGFDPERVAERLRRAGLDPEDP